MNKSSSLLLHLYLHLHLLHFLIMNKSSYLKKKKKNDKRKNFQKKKKNWTMGIGLVLLRPLSKKKKKNSSIKIFNSFKHSRFPNFSTKKKKKKKFKGPKNKILIKFFFRNRKLSSSSIFSNGATSSQLSTLSIHRSMEYVPNLGHSPGMPKSFQ